MILRAATAPIDSLMGSVIALRRFVDLQLTDPGTTTPCPAYPAGNFYGAQVSSDSIVDPATGTSTSFEPQFGAFEAGLLRSDPITVGGHQFCLDDWHSGTANFNKVDIYGCNGGVAQSWNLEANGTVVSDLGGCLDVYFSGTTSGTNVDYHQCNGTGAQQWQAKSDGELVNPESKLCLTDTGASTTAGTQVTVATCTGAADQIWQ